MHQARLGEDCACDGSDNRVNTVEASELPCFGSREYACHEIRYSDQGGLCSCCIATRGVRVCVRVFVFLFVFGIDYMEASWVVRQECVGLWCREVISGIATRGSVFVLAWIVGCLGQGSEAWGQRGDF